MAKHLREVKASLSSFDDIVPNVNDNIKMLLTKRYKLVDLFFGICFKPDDLYAVRKIFPEGNQGCTSIGDAENNQFAVCCTFIRKGFHKISNSTLHILFKSVEIINENNANGKHRRKLCNRFDVFLFSG